MNPQASRSYRVPLLIGLVALAAGLVVLGGRRGSVDLDSSSSLKGSARRTAASLTNGEGKDAVPGGKSSPVLSRTPFVPSFPAGGPIPIAATQNDLQERNGAIGYRGGKYLLTADADKITTALPTRMRNSRRPSLSLVLQDIRIGDQLLARGATATPSLKRADRTVSYMRGSVEERYVLRQNGVEQEFVIRELPKDRGDLVVRVGVQSNLSPPADGTRSSELVFKGPDQESFSISQAIALDASGRKLPIEMAFAHGDLTMTVPSAWMEKATLPVTVDPLVGGSFVLDPQITFVTERLGVAYCSATNEWLAIWSNGFGATSEEIYGARVSAAGALVGAPFLISSSSSLEDIRPAIAYSAAANRFLAVWWNRDQTSNSNNFLGRFVDPDGTMPAGPFTLLGPSSSSFDQTSVAADGSGGFYAISRSPVSSTVPFVGCLVSPSGAVTPGTDPSSNTGGNWPRVAYANNEYMVVWEDNNGIAVRRVSTAGAFLTPISYIQVQEGANANDIAGAGDRFLVTWTASSLNSLKGRVILADGASSINYGSSEIVVHSPVAYYPASAYSASSGEWYTVHASGAGLQDLKGSTVSATGAASSGAELIATPVSLYQPAVAWNSATNEMLAVFQSTATDPPQIRAQRISLSTPPAVLEGRWKFDEGSGSIAHDSSGSGNDGVVNGGATWTAGKSGIALSLDGSSGFVEVPTMGLPAANAPQSVSWWMNYASIPAGNQCVIGLTNDAAGSAVQCGFRGGLPTVWNYGGGILAQGPAPSAGAWHHYAYTFDGALHRLYVNGIQVGSSNNPAQTSAPNKLEFGRWSGDAEYYAGLLDEVRIYGGALKPGEVAALASDAALEAYFKFNEASGATTADSSGNGHTGTLLNGTTWTSGQFGSAASFDGANDSISCVLGSGLPANNAPQSITWWMNYPSVPGGVHTAIGLTNTDANSAVQAGFRDGNLTVWKWGGTPLVSAQAPTPNVWHHFAYTFDGTTHSLFIDGISANTSTATAQMASPSRLDFGFTPIWEERYSGALDEIRIYSRALSSGELVRQANPLKPEAYFKFDESSGLAAADSTGNGHDGTLNTGVTWSSGQTGSATVFDGSSGNISCTLGSGLPANNAPQTISWWMNYPSSGGVQAVVCLTNGPQNSAVQCGFRNGAVTVWNWGGTSLVSATPPPANTWHHFAYTYDGSTHRLYADGIPVGSSILAAQAAAPARLDFGFTPGYGEFYTGKLDEVKIYARTLSGAEIAQLAQDPSLAAYFKFDEGAGTATADSSGNGHNGTLVGGTTWAPGILGSSASLNGTSSSVSCAVGTGLPANNAAQTLSWWMKYTAPPTGVQAVVCLTNESQNSAVQAGFRNNLVTVWNWGGNPLVSCPTPSSGAWHHFAYTFDGSTHELYVDGTLANTSTATAQTASPSRLDFGITPTYGEYYGGGLDEVRIYARALSAAEIQALTHPSIASGVITISGPAAELDPYPPVDAAYSPSSHQWMTVWSGVFDQGTCPIWARSLDDNGVATGNPFLVNTSSGGHTNASIAYSSIATNRYLVTWDAYSTGVLGRIMNGDGTYFTGELVLGANSSSGNVFGTRAAFDGTNWFVVYAAPNAIRGRFLSTTGLLSPPIDIATGSEAGDLPQIAFANGVYVIAWRAALPRVRTMSPDGTLLSGVTPIVGGLYGRVYLSASSTSVLATWDGDGHSVHGRVISANQDAFLAFQTPTFVVTSDASASITSPAATYSSANDLWYVTWTRDGEIMGSLVDPSGGSTTPIQISSSLVFGINSSATWNSNTNTVLVAWLDGGTPLHIVGQIITLPGASTGPAKPLNLIATPGFGEISLTWGSVAGVDSYKVFRRTATTAYDFSAPLAPNVGTTSYTDMTATGLIEYFYVVRAVGTTGDSPSSNEASSIPYSSLIPPPAPSNLTATGGINKISLSWTGSTGATGYNILRGTHDQGPYLTTVRTGYVGTQLDDTEVLLNRTYFYVVTSLNVGGESGFSNQAQAIATGSGTTLLPPTNVRTTSYASLIDVEWDPSPSTNVAGYNVYRRISTDSVWPTIPVNAGVVLNFKYRDISASQPGLIYVYRVTAVGN